MKNKKCEKMDSKQIAGLTIIIISMVILTIFLIGSFVKFSGIEKEYVDSKIESVGLNATISDEDVDADSLFATTYYDALSVIADGVASGSTWLEVCLNSQVTINDEIYVKVCNSNFKTVEDLKKYVNEYATKDYTNTLMGSNYINDNNSLYILPVAIEKDSNYKGFVSYNVKQVSSNKIIYLVKSKYTEKECSEDCEYTYKEHKFVLERENNKWLVSNMEMPY